MTSQRASLSFSNSFKRLLFLFSQPSRLAFPGLPSFFISWILVLMHVFFVVILCALYSPLLPYMSFSHIFSHISTFMTEQLHWLPLYSRIHFKIIFLVYKEFLGLAPIYLCKVIMRPLSAISHRPLRSLVRNDLLVHISAVCFCFSWSSLVELSPCKNRAQILSSSLSYTPRLLKSFLFPGAYRTGGRL